MKVANAFVYAATLAVAVATASLTYAQGLLADRPFMRSLDGSISARLDGPACADNVAFNFTGPETGAFNNDRTATRLMNNVVSKMLIVLQLVFSLLFMCFAGAVYSFQQSWRAKAEGSSVSPVTAANFFKPRERNCTSR